MVLLIGIQAVLAVPSLAAPADDGVREAPAGAEGPTEANGQETPGTQSLDTMLGRLADPDTENGMALAAEIRARWARSGSPTLDHLLARGRAALAAGNARAAVGHLTALLDTAPDFAEGRFSRAEAFLLLGRPGIALDDLARALAAEPRHFPSWVLMGAILAEIGDLSGAREALRRALALNPHDVGVARALGRVERQIRGEAA